MSNMLSTGISGLNAAQVALTTVSNNIANASTPGYSRQSVQQVESVSQINGQYTIGSGVDVLSVQRSYSEYLTSALWSSNSNLQGATTANSLTSTLNSLLSNSGSLQSSLDTFYGGFSTVASSPSAVPTRQALLGNATALASVYNTLGQQLSQQQTQVNSQIGSTVTSINTAAAQIATLNGQIRQTGVTGTSNDLLDQRDTLVQTLSGLVGVSVVAQGDGTLSVYSSAGQTLVSGTQPYTLSAKSNSYDPTATDVFDGTGNDVTAQVGGGTLGALINYRDNTLNVTQNQLGQSALALVTSVNSQQAQGLDLNGQQGKAIFSVAAPTVLPSNNNASGGATVTAALSDVSQLTSADYVLRYTGTGTGTGTNGWSLATTTGQQVPLTANANGTLSAAGLTFTTAGTAQVGDSYEIQPTRAAAASLGVSLTDPRGIAAAAALTASAATANTGTGVAGAVSVTSASNANLLTGARITFGAGGAYSIVDGSGTTTTGTYTAGQPIGADGWSLALSGTPASGDSFSVAANTNGLNDNTNALALAALANKGVLDSGNTTVVSSYANLTAQVGAAGSLASTNLTTQTSLYNQALSNQQSLSGVNLNEEAANLVKFQQAYQASAQVISTAQSIFSSLITALQG